MAKTAKKPGKKASPAPKAAPASALQKKKSDAATAKAAAKHEAARGKLERVKVPPSRRDDSTEGKYVYCVIRSEQPLSFGPLGLGPEPAEVHTIHFRDIAAVVSNTPIVVQDPTRENVLAHQRVNETVMQKHTVIPMSFGTVFKTDDDIMLNADVILALANVDLVYLRLSALLCAADRVLPPFAARKRER